VVLSFVLSVLSPVLLVCSGCSTFETGAMSSVVFCVFFLLSLPRCCHSVSRRKIDWTDLLLYLLSDAKDEDGDEDDGGIPQASYVKKSLKMCTGGKTFNALLPRRHYPFRADPMADVRSQGELYPPCPISRDPTRTLQALMHILQKQNEQKPAAQKLDLKYVAIHGCVYQRYLTATKGGSHLRTCLILYVCMGVTHVYFLLFRGPRDKGHHF
jgi:hypothetical protein